MSIALVKTSDFNYTWEWVSSSSDKSIQSAFKKDKEKVLEELGKQLESQTLEPANSTLAYKVIHCLTGEKKIKNETLQQFFKNLNKAHLLEKTSIQTKEEDQIEALNRLCHEAIVNSNELLAIELLKQFDPKLKKFNGFYQGKDLLLLAEKKDLDLLIVEMLKMIKDEKRAIDIAKLVTREGRGKLMQYRGKISEYIPDYGITDQEALIDIAMRAAVQHGGAVAKFIKNYGITDQAALIKIAKIAAEKNGALTSKYIKNFGFTDQKILIEIAEIALNNNPGGISEFIQEYGITDQDILIRLAKLAAEYEPDALAMFIQNYGITDQKALVGIASIAVLSNPEDVPTIIQNFGIKENAALMVIFRVLVYSLSTDKNISLENFPMPSAFSPILFGIITEINQEEPQIGNVISDLIKYCSIKGVNLDPIINKITEKKDPEQQRALLKWFIFNLTLQLELPAPTKEELEIIEREELETEVKVPRSVEMLVRAAAIASPKEVSEFVRFYGINAQKILISMAKGAAEKDGEAVSKFIKNYQITDQAALIEIAKIAAAQSGEGISLWIQNYGITDQAALAEIAKIAARQNGRKLSENFKNFGITDLNYKIKILKKALKYHPDTSRHIGEFGIDDENVLSQLAMYGAIYNGSYIAKYISFYNIKNQKTLAKILRTALRYDPIATYEFVPRFHILDPQVRLSLFLETCNSDYTDIEKFGLSKILPYELFTSFQELELHDCDCEIVLNHLIRYTSNQGIKVDHILKQITEERNPVVKKNLLQWLAYTFTINLNTPASALNKDDILSIILNYRDRGRFELSQQLQIMNDNGSAFYDRQIKETDSNYIKLFHLFLNNFQVNDKDNDWKVISDKIKSDKLIFKDIKASMALIRALSLLSKEKSIESKDVFSLLNLAWDTDPKKELVNRLIAIEGIVLLGRSDRLKGVKPPVDLCQINEELLIEKIALEKTENLTGKVSKTLHSFRMPNAPIIYAAKLSSLPEGKNLLKEFSQYFQAVMEGQEKFSGLRYSRLNNSHLDQVFRTSRGLEQEWRKGETLVIKGEEPNFISFFESLFKSKHLLENEYSFLKETLSAIDQNEKDRIWNDLKKRDKEKGLSTEEKDRLKIQMLCIPLLNPKVDLKRKERNLISPT